MRLFLLFLIVLFLVVGAAQAADRFPVDWPKAQSELMEHYTKLLRIDTSNPPGNETLAVNYVKSVLDREGIPNQVYALDPNRANLVARIKGNGSKRPIVVMGHTDVVGVQREKWSVDPFAALRKDGYIYGRGTLDDKDNLSTGVMLMLLLKRMNIPLDRDVIFVTESGEEGAANFGMTYLVNQHWDAMDAEFGLAEGGGGYSRDGKVRSVTISTTEKVPRGARRVAHGTAGHASIPRPDNAITRLSEAVGKIGNWIPPMRLNDTTRTYFERLASISAPEEADRYNHLADPARSAEIQRYLLEHEGEHYSMLRTSAVPTIIKGGFRSNVIPSEGEANIDIRALPDEDMPKFYDAMRKVIGDPSVEVVPGATAGRAAPPPSRLDSEMYRALEKSARDTYPGAVPLPMMLNGATDGQQLRARGVQTYGIGPVVEEQDANTTGPHSDGERLRESALYGFMQFLWNAVTEVAASRK